jgi:TPP-dependent pyruvate/acetoin dehydrogenase alpha subunit
MSATLTREQSLDIYYYLRLNRSVEELLARLFRQNKVFGGVYGSLGQEAISVGAAYALGPDDWIAPMIRNIGALLVRGFKPREILTQHMARATSPTLGKDGTSHMGDLYVRHVIAPTSVLGDLISVMAGVAMGGRYLGQKIVALTWTGDGGTSTGAFHEGLNFAAVQKAPLVVVVENNGWAYSTPVSRQVALQNLADRALAYGMPSMIVDGNDVVAVVRTVRQAVQMARDGRGPILVEAKTMRMVGHAQHDSAGYVPPDMLAYWKTRDPIALFEKYLTSNRLWDAAAKAAIDERVANEIAEDLAVAENEPPPLPETAAQGVYCDGCHTIEAKWQRPQKEVSPPQSSISAAWAVQSFENGKKPDFGKSAKNATRRSSGRARK